MKVNIFLLVISVLSAGLIGFLYFNLAESNANDIVYCIGGGICSLSALIPMLGVEYNSSRLGINIRVLSLLFLILFATSHIVCIYVCVKMTYYIIINSLLLLIFLSLLYKMQKINSI